MMKKGITLVELLIVVAILAIMIAAAVGGINPIGIMNKARDAQRKKDLNRIKISFEDYFNDKGCYPNKIMVDKLNLNSNCSTNVFNPWLGTWPCDPNGKNYQVLIGYDDNCPKWYKVLAVLENKKDNDIPASWILNGNTAVGNTAVNYGVSSVNISLEEVMGAKDPYCIWLGNCYYFPEANHCNQINGCKGDNCYMGECSTRCKVACCGSGCN